MENFNFCSPTKIIFGKATEDCAGQETAKYGKRVLLHYGGGSIKKTGLYDKVVKSLKEAGVDYIELSGVEPNPRLSLVKEGIKICRTENIDFILAVGGGSVIDSAKAISIGVPYDGDVWDFYSGKAEPEKSLGLGVILTISAAGSEASKSSVITNEDGWYKRGLGFDIVRPEFAIMNPELTFTVSAYQTACGSVDIMAHIMERYFTNTLNVELTDRLCEGALKTVINNTPIALKEPGNYNARAEIMWTGTLAHNDLLGTGRIGDWASHQIEHELSAIYDIAHGAGLAIVFPAWMKYVFKSNTKLFAQFANRVWNVDYSFESPEQTALEGINRMDKFFREMGLPTTLRDAGIPEDRLEEMAQKCRLPNGDSVGNVVKLTRDDVLNIYMLAK
ncbi:MAG TPA: iron-containing alcohol dehydrogenase [Clostridiales bacterium]|nr:iron-containing alcohol dehydrogenase [Clostridiales bacterium]